MTKNQNPGLIIFSLFFFFFVFVRWGAALQGKGRYWQGVEAIIFICDQLYQRNTR